MSCICIAGSNQPVLDLVAKVLKSSGMTLLVNGKVRAISNKNLSAISGTFVDGAQISITPYRLSKVTQSEQSTELVGWADTSNLHSLTELLRAEPSLRFVLVTSKVTDAIVQALEDYDSTFDCSQTVHAWQQTQQKLLHFFYRHRERCLLVDSKECLENVQDFVRECKLSFSVKLQVPKEQLSVWSKLDNSVYLHFAKSLIESYPEALSLENEIATCVRKLSNAQDIGSVFETQGAGHFLLNEYRAQRQQSQVALKQWVDENTTLLRKIESIQTENQQLFNQSQKSEQQLEILSEEAEIDRKTIANLQAELVLAKSHIAEVRAENNDLLKNNEKLFFDLNEALRESEFSFERNVNLETQVKALDTQVNNSKALADLMQVDLDRALQKNIYLQEKQVEVEAENDILLTQFQHSLIDLESYILKNRTLHSQIAVEQESTKALEARVREVIAEYEMLDQAHIQWRAERDTLIDQINLKQNALALQSEEAERSYQYHQSQSNSLQEKNLEIEAESQILLHQFLQSLIDLELYVLKNRTLESKIEVEQESTKALEARLHEVTSVYETLNQAHIQWRVERETLIEQIQLKQNALNLQSEESVYLFTDYQLRLADLQKEQSEFKGEMQVELLALKNSYEDLLHDLSQEQSLAVQRFIHDEQMTSKLKSLEFEKSGAEARLSHLLQKYQIPANCERIELLALPLGDQFKTLWQAIGLETGRYLLPSIVFSTIIENSAVGFIFSRQQASNNGLIRWPVILATAAELVLSPVGDTTTGPVRAETWLSLATTDLDTVIALSLTLEQELKAGSISAHLGQNFSIQMLKGLQAFKQLSIETQGTFRYDQVRLKRAIVNDDYEHLWFEFDNVRYRQVRLKHFECRVACSELISKRFGIFPKLEFPHLESQQSLDSWFAESHDDFGAKLELRFAPPAVFDTEVWGKLSHDDQGLIFSLLERLPTILREVDLDQAGLHRPWPQWNNVIERMSKSLEPAMTSQQLMDATHSEPPMIVEQESVVILNSRPDPLKFGAAGATTAAKGLATLELTKRPTSSAFLSFLQES
jgi:hypothetical protein